MGAQTRKGAFVVHREYTASEEGLESFLNMMATLGGPKLLARRYVCQFKCNKSPYLRPAGRHVVSAGEVARAMTRWHCYDVGVTGPSKLLCVHVCRPSHRNRRDEDEEEEEEEEEEGGGEEGDADGPRDGEDGQQDDDLEEEATVVR